MAEALTMTYDGQRLRLAGRRSSFADPVEGLRHLASLVRATDKALKETVTRARTSGRTWAEIGDALGMSRQAAWERFSGESQPDDTEPPDA
jgi:hypothetical protein